MKELTQSIQASSLEQLQRARAGCYFHKDHIAILREKLILDYTQSIDNEIANCSKAEIERRFNLTNKAS